MLWYRLIRGKLESQNFAGSPFVPHIWHARYTDQSDILVLTRYSRFAKMHEKTAVTGLLFTIFFLGLIRKAATTDQCNGPRQIPIQGNMLKGHIYETRWVRSGYAECLFICREEKVCQSFNFVVKESKCEFNNRTKEACSPEDFVFDLHRLYVKLDVSRGKELWNCLKRYTSAF